MEQKKSRKKLLIALLAALLLVGVGGTVAWLTSSNTLVNEFTVGTFSEPTTDPEDSSQPLDKVNGNFDGNLYEKNWNPNEEHKLMPGTTYQKDPYVGIGPGSEDGVVYVYVENNFTNTDKIYFTINNGWEAVAGKTTAGAVSGSYKSGLFKYTAGLVGKADEDSWTTTPLFTNIVVADDATSDDFEVAQGQDTAVTVKSFIHQAKDSSGADISASEIQSAAETAFGIA